MELDYKIRYIKQQLDRLIEKKKKSIVRLNFSIQSEKLIMLTETSSQKNGHG